MDREALRYVHVRDHKTWIAAALAVAFASSVAADHSPAPSSVTVAGSLQSELGCPGDWQPDCAATHLGFDAEDTVWQRVFAIPAGDWEYKGALNDSWDENYGANAIENGPNIALSLGAPTDVKFYYDHETHWLTDNVNSVIATAVGSFQSELGCAGDWRPDCLRSWLQDPDGDGVFTFSAVLPGGDYEALVAIGETFDESYGLGGVPSGPNIPFTVPSGGAEMRFVYDSVSHVMTVEVGPLAPPSSVIVFDDMEHGDPGNNGWFTVGGNDAGGVISPNTADLPPSDGGAFSLETQWASSGGIPTFYGLFGRTNPTDLSGANYFSFWINPDAGGEYTLEFTLQDDDNGDLVIDQFADDSFRFDCLVGPTGPCAIAGGGWQRVSIPLADFVDVGSGNGVLDPFSVANGGNGELINIIVVVLGDGSDILFRTDYWAFSAESPVVVPVTTIDDFENGVAPGTPCAPSAPPLGFCTFNGVGSSVTITGASTPPAPDLPAVGTPNNVLQMDVDSTSFAGFIRGFTNAAGDTWTPQDWSTSEGTQFWMYGTGSGSTMFMDILDNRNPGSTTDDAERWTVAFLDDFVGWELLEFPWASFVRKEIGNGAPNDGLTLLEVHGYTIGTLNTGGPRIYYVDDVGIYGGTEDDDTDGDGVPDDEDICAGGDDSVDFDMDSVPDFCDVCPFDAANDSDGDGVCDGDDLCLGNDASGDTDDDGSCDDEDPCFGISNIDADGDGFCDEGDLCYGDDAAGNTDGDAVCDDLDACDGDDATGDTDGDLSCDDLDMCPLDPENDGDGDGFCESDDNCPGVANAGQDDQDGDFAGDACDNDIDGDGVPNDADNCFLDVNTDQSDADHDGVGDACDNDSDGDEVLDVDDVCLGTPAGSPVLENGCSVEQACPCDGNWKNHGAYEKCISLTLKDLRKAGTITAQEARTIRASSKNNQCGKTGRGRPHHDDGDDDFEDEDDHQCRDKGHRHGKGHDRH